jgi:hypothetical protein
MNSIARQITGEFTNSLFYFSGKIIYFNLIDV